MCISGCSISPLHTHTHASPPIQPSAGTYTQTLSLSRTHDFLNAKSLKKKKKKRKRRSCRLETRVSDVPLFFFISLSHFHNSDIMFPSAESHKGERKGRNKRELVHTPLWASHHQFIALSSPCLYMCTWMCELSCVEVCIMSVCGTVSSQRSA